MRGVRLTSFLFCRGHRLEGVCNASHYRTQTIGDSGFKRQHNPQPKEKQPPEAARVEGKHRDSESGPSLQSYSLSAPGGRSQHARELQAELELAGEQGSVTRALRETKPRASEADFP